MVQQKLTSRLYSDTKTCRDKTTITQRYWAACVRGNKLMQKTENKIWFSLFEMKPSKRRSSESPSEALRAAEIA